MLRICQRTRVGGLTRTRAPTDDRGSFGMFQSGMKSDPSGIHADGTSVFLLEIADVCCVSQSFSDDELGPFPNEIAMFHSGT